jgi:hypothetical protein
MDLAVSVPMENLLSTEGKPEPVESMWVRALERLPDDAELVHVILPASREIRIACRGRYQSTSAWFDAQTHNPIYEMVTHWKPRDEQLIAARKGPSEENANQAKTSPSGSSIRVDGMPAGH